MTVTNKQTWALSAARERTVGTATPWVRIAGAGSGGRGIFARRQNSSIHSELKFSGFSLLSAFTASQPSTGTRDAANNNKPRILSVGGQYSAGPIFVSAGYERHKDANGGGTVAPPFAAGAVSFPCR